MALETTLLKATVRKEVGTKYAAKLRKEGKVLAVVYGHKQEPVAISLDSHDFNDQIHQGQRLLDVEIEAKQEKLLIKDLQYDYLGKQIIHVDLMRVDLTETVRVTAALEFKGPSKGSLEGGILDEHLNSLEVECLVSNIPDTIEVSVKDLDVGDILHAADIELPDNVKLITNSDVVVIACHLAAAEKSTEDLVEEVPSDPEVLTESKKDDEEESEESGK